MLAYPSEIRSFVDQALASGEFQSEDALLIEAVRVMRNVRQRQEELRRDIQIAIDELDRGEGSPLDMGEIKRALAARMAEARKVG